MWSVAIEFLLLGSFGVTVITKYMAGSLGVGCPPFFGGSTEQAKTTGRVIGPAYSVLGRAEPNRYERAIKRQR